MRPKPLRILGIDPGTNVLGFAVIEIYRKEVRLVTLDVVRMDRGSEHADKLRQIVEELGSIIDRFHPGQLAIEAPFYGKNIQSMLKLGRAQGVAIATAMTRGLSISEYSPRKIKQAITGNGNASKEQLAAMLSQILRHDVRHAPLDATDALGVALCHHFQKGSKAGIGKTGNYKGWKGFLAENPNRKKS